jgi:hypothetical protein
LCLLFPPTLLLYWNAGDKVIAIVSGGKHLKCHGKAKTWAGIAGLASLVPCAVAVGFIIAYFARVGRYRYVYAS